MKKRTKLTLGVFAVSLLALIALGGFVLETLTGGGRVSETPLAVTFRPIEPVREALAEVEPQEAAFEREEVVGAAETIAEPASVPATGARMAFVDDEGSPVEGVRAYVRYHEEYGATSDAAGAVLVRIADDANEWAYHRGVQFEHPAYVAGDVDAILVAGQVTELGAVVLHRAGAIAVRVLDSTGLPVEGAWVEQASGEGYRREEMERTQLRKTAHTWHKFSKPMTNAEGRYLLENVREGLVRVWAGGQGHLAMWSAPLEVRGGMISEEVVLTLGVPDSADFIRGQVVDPDGRPVPRAGLKYKYRSRFGGSGSGSSTTDEQGRFVIAYSPRTPRDLRGSDPKNRYVSATAEGVEGGDDVVLRLAAAEHMTVTVKTEEGTREGLRLWGYNADHTDILIRSNKVEVGGERMRLPIPREPFLLEIAADGHEQIQLGPFDGLAAPRELDVTLASLPGVRGRVTAGGEPVAGARVALHAPVTSQTAHNGYPVRLGDNPSAQGTTGEDGTFRLDLRQGGDFLLRASAEGLAASEFGPIFIDPARGVVGLKLELTPGGAIEGTLWGGEAVAGRIVAISRGDTYAQTARSDREGRFRFEQLTPGPWLVKLAKEEISPHSSTTTSSRAAFKESDIESNCAVIEGQTTRHDISLAGVGEVVLAGTLRMDGAPAVGWKAMLFPGDAGGMLHGSGRLQTTVSEDGSFRLMAPKSGEYRLVLNPPNTSFMALTNTVQLVLGETSWHAEYQTGSVRILNASTAVDSSRALDFLIGDDGRMNLMVKVLGDEQGVAVITGVPVMPADLVRFTLEEMIASQDPTSGGTPVISVDLIPGQEVVVSLP